MKTDNKEELNLYVNHLQFHKEIKYDNPEKLAKDLKKEFNIDITEEELIAMEYFLEGEEQDVEDMQLIYNRLY